MTHCCSTRHIHNDSWIGVTGWPKNINPKTSPSATCYTHNNFITAPTKTVPTWITNWNCPTRIKEADEAFSLDQLSQIAVQYIFVDGLVYVPLFQSINVTSPASSVASASSAATTAAACPCPSFTCSYTSKCSIERKWRQCQWWIPADGPDDGLADSG